MEFLKRAKSSEHLIKEIGLLVDPEELQKVEKKKKMVSVFVVNKCSRKICRAINDTVIKSLTFLEVKLQRVIRGKGCFMWNILLPSSANCESVKSGSVYKRTN